MICAGLTKLGGPEFKFERKPTQMVSEYGTPKAEIGDPPNKLGIKNRL